MRAAVVHAPVAAPRYGEFDEPIARDGIAVVDVAACALSHLTRARASGTHYSAAPTFPFVPGVDGVGSHAGRRVFFMLPEAPFGGMAERVAVRADRLVEIPDGVDDVTAAAIANAGMSSWAALVERARLRPGETVLVNGATGASGRLAVRIAKHLGAGRVVATGRNRGVLEALRAEGADATIALDAPRTELDSSLARAFGDGVDVVLDYLWGTAGEAVLAAAASGDPSRAVRFVNIGSMSGGTVALPAAALRSSGLVVMGSGLGSVPLAALLASIDGVFRAVVPAGLRVETSSAPLADIERRWDAEGSDRLVFRIG